MSPLNRVIRRLLARWCSHDMMGRVIDQVLADSEFERRRALAESRPWRARLSTVRGVTALCRAVMLQTLHAASNFEPTAEARARQSFWLSTLLMVASTVLLATLPFVDAFAHHPGNDLWLFLCLLPSAWPVGLTVAPVVGALWSGGRAYGGKHTGHWPWATAMACSVLSLLVLAWLAPEANQAFRQAFYQTSTDAQRGVSELTLVELGGLVQSGSRPADLMAAETTAKATLALHLRGSLALAPLVFTFAALAFARRTRGAFVRLGVGLVALVLYLAWGFGVAGAEAPEEHHLLAAWSPLLAAFGAGLVARGQPAPDSGQPDGPRPPAE